MSLDEEIRKKSSEIYREAYQMSIGELINLYKDEEVDIHPEFQRLFRWNDSQKTSLIESILLNIPIPQIFVSQREDGTWDVVDGVQRLSTIFQFVGVLKDENGHEVPPLVLQGTDDLPSLEGMKWKQNANDDALAFTKEQQLSLKRSRLDVVIIKKESDAKTKYELFQRLNTGGSQLSDQEVRNCLMIMSNKMVFDTIENLSKNRSFDECMNISLRKSDEQYALEMIVRLLVALNIDWDEVSKYKEMSELLDKEVIRICDNTSFDFTEFSSKFERTFDLLLEITGEDSFRKYNGQKFTGPFLSAAFQTITVGIYKNIDDIMQKSDYKNWIKSKIEKLYSETVYINNTVPGIRAIPRFKALSVFGEGYFRNDED